MTEIFFTDKLAKVAGFVYGFVDSFYENDTNFQHPFSAIVYATVNGAVYSLATGLVSKLIPTVAKPILPMVLVLATLKKHPEIVECVTNSTKEGGAAAINDLQLHSIDKLKDASDNFMEAGKEMVDSIQKQTTSF
jgi:hypothetical protein